MTQFNPHVLDAVRGAHTQAAAQVESTRVVLRRAAEAHRQAEAAYVRALAREAGLAVALQDQRLADEATEATRCASCGMAGGKHTGGCLASAAQLDAYAQERRARLNVDQAREDQADTERETLTRPREETARP